MHQIIPGGALAIGPSERLYIYEVGTTSEGDVYDAEMGGSVISQPLVPDADGSFPDHWVEDDRDYDRVIVGDATNARTTWRVRKPKRVIYPRSYGASENETSDESAALNACVSDALDGNHNDVTIAPMPCVYNLDGALDTSDGGNTIVSLFDLGANKSLRIAGEPRASQVNGGYQDTDPVGPRTVFKTSRTGDTYSATDGPPSIMGSSTFEGIGWNPGDPTHTVGELYMEHIDFQVPLNPEIGALDTLMCAGFHPKDVDVYAGVTGGDASSVPTHPHAFGIRWPARWGGPVNKNERAAVYQFYVGHVTYHPDHQGNEQGWAFHCQLAYGFERPLSAEALQGAYGVRWEYAQMGACKVAIAGWDPETGVEDVPFGVFFNNSVIQTEDAQPPWELDMLIDDGANRCKGDLLVHHFHGLGQSSPAVQPPVIDGAQNLRLKLSNDGMATIAAASTLEVPTWSKVTKVSAGSGTINTITASYPERVLGLIATGSFTITEAGNLKLHSGPISMTADDQVWFVCDGTDWWQVAPPAVN